jgi:hypothetical protein
MLVMICSYFIKPMCCLYIDYAKTIPARSNAIPPTGIVFLEDGWERN